MSTSDKPATREELHRLLRAAEWTNNGRAFRCFWCARYQADGHREDCELADVLRRARLPELQLVPPTPQARLVLETLADGYLNLPIYAADGGWQYLWEEVVAVDGDVLTCDMRGKTGEFLRVRIARRRAPAPSDGG